ncbi:methionine aminopeptidase 2-like protein [Talaromyces proteolyticus]|uniref:Methionine aminopeptidase 2 n=1 Tax=Talaromyces proteolyticus TaxID=1131652 RepID=A0AAD4KWI0_9EURO|nr:methionine aminopeptidase 2-like protein [Talaromyces proteolyticus]KAH8701626.1 methionine aminopeptidase 2-like protein [Talaromyces proteolyticus]
MGSQSYEGKQHHEDASSSVSTKSNAVGGKPRGANVLEDGDGDFDSGDDDEDGNGKDPTMAMVTGTQEGQNENPKNKKKKKRSNKKKKKTGASAPGQQSFPPRVPLSQLFPDGKYPPGQMVEPQDSNLSRTTGEELRYLERGHIANPEVLNDYRKGAEIHRQVRHWVQETAKPGYSLTDLAEGIEDGVRALLGHQGLEPGDSLKGGMGFPTGLALNDCAAHFTPNPGQKEVFLKKEDVMKVDFGVHVNGWIVDCAFTMTWDPTYDNLLAAVKDATNTGLRSSGVDARICDISASIQEAMESYEVEINKNVYPVKAIRNITGHNIKPYIIHGGKSVPFVKNNDQTKMEEGEVFAIETFGTTGKGILRDGAGVYGYGKIPDAPSAHLPLASARSLLKTINQNFGTIVFCRRYLDRLGIDKYLLGMNSLISNGIVEIYHTLDDIKGSYTAQFEHTILIKGSGNEIISRGDDY